MKLRSTALDQYSGKRDFDATPEPSANGKQARATAGNLRFVVQRHDASHLHYDFRLEAGGVLKSWAIPKGPSMDPKNKRLAVQVEDHPLSYRTFEGIIPKGNYGAGKVQVWDQGTYEPIDAGGEKTIFAGLQRGSLKFMIHGNKLKGLFSLVQLKNGNGKNWLLIKHKEQSTKSKVKDKKPVRKSAPTIKPGANKLRGSVVSPMKAQPFDSPFDDPGWIFEVKYDGYRAIAEVGRKNVRLYSRNGLSFARTYPHIFSELKKIKINAVLDGEIVALDKNGRPSFQKLQQYAGRPGSRVVFYVFDCLSFQNKDCKKLPLLKRKELILSVLSESSSVVYVDHTTKSGIKFFAAVKEMDLEGMVAKRSDSVYTPGKRSVDWLKIKNRIED